MHFTELLAEHGAAVREFRERAGAVPAKQWDVARAPGKWTPAQEVKHIALGLEAFARDLRGEGKLRLKGKWWQRRLWRLTALRTILRTRRIFRAAPAPREVRPPERPGDQTSLLAELQSRWNDLESLLIEMHRANPRRCVTHPYFGDLSLPDLVRFSVIHVRHHTAFLPSLEPLAASSR
jgi:hypothetical protein